MHQDYSEKFNDLRSSIVNLKLRNIVYKEANSFFIHASRFTVRKTSQLNSNMETSLHHEEHLESSAFLRDIVIGMSDGLTVPFALAAGLSGAVDSTNIIVIAGIAE